MAYALPSRREELRLSELNTYVDSFCTNPHKWGLVGMDCCDFLRILNPEIFADSRLDSALLRSRSDSSDGSIGCDAGVSFNTCFPSDLTRFQAFLRSKEGDSGAVIDYRNWQIALGRRFRSVKLWFVLRSYGVDGYRRHLETVRFPALSRVVRDLTFALKGIDHCERLAGMVKASPGFELVTTPRLSLLVFRLRPSAKNLIDAELNFLNQQLYTRLSTRYDVFLTQTELSSTDRKIFCIRFALGGLNTTMEDVEAVWKVVEEEGSVILRDWEGGTM